MEFKGTKGEWFWTQTLEGYSINLKAPNDGSIFHPSKICGEIETKANAKLIAAAPDLLEVLQECVTSIRGEINPSNHLLNTLSNVESAINKALKL